MSAEMALTSSREFVRFGYRRILGRDPGPEEEEPYVAALNRRALTRELFLLQLLRSQEFDDRVSNVEYFPTGHYYSAVPSARDRADYVTRWKPTTELGGIDINAAQQLELLNAFKAYYDECPFQPDPSPNLRYHFENPSYSYTDGIVLYSMLRHFRPRRVIEIGSGYSSAAMLDTAERFLDNSVDFTFIEPYPELLRSLLTPTDSRSRIIASPLQDVSLDTFTTLEASDILFIDSTHVAKVGSDVNMIVFDILPVLAPGVIVHFHDIFWPFDYPLDWIQKGYAWNEAYVLRAFLEFNDAYRIIFFGNYLHRNYESWFAENMPLCLRNSGGNIWLRRQAPALS